MTSRSWSLLSVPVVAALLAALTLGLILLGSYLGLGPDAFFLLAVPVVLAVVYLAWYRTLPYEAPRTRPNPTGPSAPSTDEEDFEDPVEEADLIESGVEVPEDADLDDEGVDATPPSKP
jgi:hypothetical protein